MFSLHLKLNQIKLHPKYFFAERNNLSDLFMNVFQSRSIMITVTSDHQGKPNEDVVTLETSAGLTDLS